jgi:hypothetical protein
METVLNKGYTPEFVPPADRLNFSHEYVSQQPVDSAPHGGQFLAKEDEKAANFMGWTYDGEDNEDIAGQ